MLASKDTIKKLKGQKNGRKYLQIIYWSLGREDPLEKEMATHSSTLAWQIPWTEEPGGLQSMGPQRAGRDGGTKWRQQQNSTFIRWNSAVKRMETRTHATRRKLDSIMPNEGSRRIPHTAWSIYMKCPEEANLQKQKVCQWLLGAWGSRKWSDC